MYLHGRLTLDLRVRTVEDKHGFNTTVSQALHKLLHIALYHSVITAHTRYEVSEPSKSLTTTTENAPREPIGDSGLVETLPQKVNKSGTWNSINTPGYIK